MFWATLVVLIGAAVASDEKWHYGVMIDAGSTGSRCYIYKWPYRYSDSVPLVEELYDQVHQQALSLKVKPGLATFVDKIDDVAAYLKPLLDFAELHVPESQRATTPLFLFGTAGMRTLTDDEQDAILSAVSAVFSGSGFNFGPNNAGVITGTAEALYGWIAVNYLKKTLGTSATVGSLDLGGASTQIAFEVSPDASSFPGLMHVRFNGHVYPVYVVSYLGFGNNLFRDRVSEILVANTPPMNISYIADPCLNPGCSLNYTDSDGFTHLLQGTTETSAGSECYKLSTDVMDLISEADCSLSSCVNISSCRCSIYGRRQPQIDLTTEFYAMSAYFWTIDFLNSTSIPNSILDATEKFCQRTCANITSSYPDNDFADTYCGNGNQVYALLKDAYGFNEKSQHLHMVDAIDDKEVTWALGAMIMQANLLPIDTNNSKAMGTSTTAWIAASAVLALIAAVFAAFWFRNRSRSAYQNIDSI